MRLECEDIEIGTVSHHMVATQVRWSEDMSKKLLIIDDDDLFLAVMQVRLEQEGLCTITCRTIQDAVRLFREINPDLVLLSIRYD